MAHFTGCYVILLCRFHYNETNSYPYEIYSSRVYSFTFITLHYKQLHRYPNGEQLTLQTAGDTSRIKFQVCDVINYDVITGTYLVTVDEGEDSSNQLHNDHNSQDEGVLKYVTLIVEICYLIIII